MPRKKTFTIPGALSPDELYDRLADVSSYDNAPGTGLHMSEAPDLWHVQQKVSGSLRFFRLADFGVVRPLIELSPRLKKTIGGMVEHLHAYAATSGFASDEYLAITDPGQLEIDLVHSKTSERCAWHEVPDYLNGLIAELPYGTARLTAHLGAVMVGHRRRHGNRRACTRVALAVASPVIESEKGELSHSIEARTGRPVGKRTQPGCTIARLPPMAEQDREALQVSLRRFFDEGMGSEAAPEGVPITCAKPTPYLYGRNFE